MRLKRIVQDRRKEPIYRVQSVIGQVKAMELLYPISQSKVTVREGKRGNTGSRSVVNE